MQYDDLKIGQFVTYIDPVNYEKYDCNIIFIEPGEYGIVFFYLKAIEDKLNIHTDPKFTDRYFVITNNKNIMD